MSTITGTTINSGITLGTSGNYISPLTVASDGAVEASGDAIYGPNTQAWAVVNYGTIIGTSGNGVTLGDGGSVNNLTVGALIEGSDAIRVAGGAGTVTNSGTVVGSSGYGVIFGVGGTVDNNDGVISGSARGVYIYGGGAVTNTGTGLIEGYGGVRVVGYAGAITNSATIMATGLNFDPVFLQAGGSVDNTGTGLIEGYGNGIRITGAAGTVTNSATITGTNSSGVVLAAGGTVIDSGTIGGGNGTAVNFGGSGSNLLVLENGFQLSGVVVGSGAATDTLELAGTSGAAVTADYNALGLSSFEVVQFGTGGYSTLTLSNTGTVPVTISGFDQTSDVIDLTGIGNDGTISNLDTVNNQITVHGAGGDVTLQFDSLGGLNFTTISDGGTGTDLSPACFCRGTLILTDRGEVAVENLAIGDRVVTVSGAAKPIKWIGRRGYDPRFVVGNRAMLPIRFAAGALADGVPARDLHVSPEHSLYINGVLVAASHLVNGATIVQAESVAALEYFHVELDAHDIIFADGAPAESYVECDNRGRFHNAAEFAALYPAGDHPRWQFCAPLLQWESDEPNPIRETLLRRAEALGHQLDLDPDLHLIVDGAAVQPDSIDGRVYRFTIPAGSTAASLASRCAVPAEVRATARDRRRLGVPVKRLVLCNAGLRLEAEHGDAGLADGFHEDEAGHRWTDGLARLPESWLRAFTGAFTLEVHLIGAKLSYRLPHQARTCAIA